MSILPDDRYNLLLTLMICVLYQLFFFSIAARYRFDKVTDLAGGSNFVLLAVVTWCLGGNMQGRTVALNVMVIAWGLRLSAFLFYRILKIDKDDRFDKLRDNYAQFAFFWLFQLLWVWVVSMPISYSNGPSDNPPLNGIDATGLAFAAVGLMMEAIADQTKFIFKMDPANKNAWCQNGIWSYSRHPNYCGELMFWWGIFLSSTQQMTSFVQYYCIASPIFITVILLGFSGLPILEKGANTRFGDRADYLEYRRKTSILLPMPCSVYINLPMIIKVIFFFEFPCYDTGFDEELSLSKDCSLKQDEVQITS